METNWDQIIREAIATYHGQKGDLTGLEDIKYSELTKAVLSMKYDKPTKMFRCGSGCSDIVKKAFQLEKDYVSTKSSIKSNTLDLAVYKILNLLLKGAFPNVPDATIDNSNIMTPTKGTLYGNKPPLITGGGTKRTATWRREMTRRIHKALP